MSQIVAAMRRAQTEIVQSTPTSLWTPVGNERSYDPVQEASQRLAQGVLAHPESERLKVILVVSGVQGEGASTVARKLASTLSQDDKKHVLLVDANLRAPSQHLAFNITRTGGLSEVASGVLEIDRAVTAVTDGSGPGLSLLTCGRPAKSPPHLFSLSKLGNVIEALRLKFHWVIVDGPPVTHYSEAATLASLSDGIVMVLQAEQTRWEVAEQAKRILEESGSRILGAVLNRRQFHIPDYIYKRL